MKKDNKFRHFLDKKMEELGVTLNQLSRDTEIHYATLYNLRSGNALLRNISFQTAAKLANALNVTMEELYKNAD